MTCGDDNEVVILLVLTGEARYNHTGVEWWQLEHWPSHTKWFPSAILDLLVPGLHQLRPGLGQVLQLRADQYVTASLNNCLSTCGLARERCRISPPCFLAMCRNRRSNRGSFVLLCFVLFVFFGLCLVCVLSVFLICLLSCIFQRELHGIA